MAEQSISYGIGLSDQMINQMLQSDDPNIVAQAQEYVNTAQEQQPQKTGILQKIGNFFFPLQPVQSLILQQINFHLDPWLIWQLQMS